MKVVSAARDYLAAQGMARALRHRDFRLFVTTHWVSAVGMWVQRVGVLWLTWELTHSGLWLGIVAAAEAVPMFLIMPFAGALTDRVDRLPMFRKLIVVNAMFATLLATLTLTGLIDATLLVAIIASNATVQAMAMPARMTMVPGMVPRPDVPAAIGLSSILFQVSAFVGPATAGFVITGLGVGYAFAFNALSYILYIVTLFFIRLVHDQPARRGHGGLVADTWAGLRYVGQHGAIAPVLLLLVAAVIFVRPYMDLMPGFADVIFGRGADGLATLMAAAGVGGMVAGLWLANYGRVERMTSFVMAAVVMGAAVLLVFATTGLFWLAVPCVAVIAAALTLTSTGSEMLVQNAVDGAMRGRVMSLFVLTWRALPASGTLVMGALSSHYGLQAPVAGAAVLCLVGCAVALPRWRRIARGLERAASPHAGE